MSGSYCSVFLADDCQLTGRDFACELGLFDKISSFVGEETEIADIADDEIAIGKHGGWHVVFGSAGLFLETSLSETCQKASSSGQVFLWLSQGASGGLWFEYYDHGLLGRRWVQVEGVVEQDEGLPLPCEQEVLGKSSTPPVERDFWFLVELAECLTGISWSGMSGHLVNRG